ncbi:MAG: hypothetical protein QXS62_04180 [Sulfolobales archaeon]
MNNIIKIDDVYVAHNGHYVLEAITLVLSSPTYAFLVGPNEAGKPP